ncbi:uncharacterized protein LOC127863341 [Dreissena polymorpha]|uniref:uncharacterized protein LOC127863341 n=1 Tax=Dreissena polymorpha TaxID=45954 RepID=UPI002263DD80|nr:uncharacterized protein LOC127863341 [Dreissena polymorpha]
MAFRHMHQAIEKAKQESSNQHKARQLISDMHKRNIDALLASNGLERVRIEGDGNCLFKAVCVSTCDFESPEVLRQKLCDHLSAKLDTYIDFLPNNTCANKRDKYISKVNCLREEGHWDNDLADALPLAMANVSGRVLKIYCSRRANPMYEIRPTLHADTDANDCINLAFIQVPGLEHYDACTNAITPKNANYDFTDTGIPTNEHTETVDVQTITPRKKAKYNSPAKFTGKRKQPEKWKKNIRKKQRMLGLQYTNTKGKTVEAKRLLDARCNCRYKCRKIFTHEQRDAVFQNYCNIGSYERQKDFLCSNVKDNTPERVRSSAKKRSVCSRSFYLDNKRVCKDFFLRMLHIDNRVVETALKSSSTANICCI